MPDPTRTVPRIIVSLASPFEWRHVRGVAALRGLVALWLCAIGIIAMAMGDWWGVLLFAAAGLVGWLAYQMPRWKVVLDADSGDDRPDA